MSLRQKAAAAAAQEELAAHERRVVPVIEERLTVEKRFVESGGAVRIRKRIHEEVVKVDEPLRLDEVEIDRVAMDREIDGPVGVRYEGDVMIVPVVEERMVIRKQLFLTAEIRRDAEEFISPGAAGVNFAARRSHR